MTDSEAELISRSIAGDERAFARLMAPLEPGLRQFLGGRLRMRPDVSVDDALQEVRIYLFRRLDRYLPEYPLAAFAHGLAGNIARRILHKRSDLLPANGHDDEVTQDLMPDDVESQSSAFHAVLGKNRFDPPDRSGPSDEFLELLEIFLRYGGYPHQQISFGYSILLWGRSKQPGRRKAGADTGGQKVPITGDADRVVAEVGCEFLRVSGGELMRDIEESLRIDARFMAQLRLPLDRRLEMVVADLFARDATSLKLFRRLADRFVGETRLEEYFGGDGRQSVTDWTRAVKDRIRKVVLDASSAGHSLLPMD